MSHFTKIQTKLKYRPALLEALNLLGHFPEEEKELKVTGYHGKGHETVTADIAIAKDSGFKWNNTCLLYTSPSPRDRQKSRMPSSA